MQIIFENPHPKPYALTTGLVGYLEYPEEYPKPHNEPYTVYNLNQVTQSLLYNLYPNQFEIHHNHPPNTKIRPFSKCSKYLSNYHNHFSNDSKYY